MTIQPNLNSIGTLPHMGSAAKTTTALNGSGFEDTLRDAVNEVQQLGDQAQQKVAELLNGSGQDIHSTTLAVQQANLSFELMLQVRNKIVSAYQEISRLQF